MYSFPLELRFVLVLEIFEEGISHCRTNWYLMYCMFKCFGNLELALASFLLLFFPPISELQMSNQAGSCTRVRDYTNFLAPNLFLLSYTCWNLVTSMVIMRATSINSKLGQKNSKNKTNYNGGGLFWKILYIKRKIVKICEWKIIEKLRECVALS